LNTSKNWNYNKYTNSQLNSVNITSLSFNRAKDIYSNLSARNDKIVKNSIKHYSKEVKQYQETKNKQLEKSNLISVEE
jgi:predicted transcriptional regulator